VAPGPHSLGAELGPWHDYALTSAQNVPLDIQPGQTVKVVLGGKGRTVVGRVALPQGIQRTMHWDYGINDLVAMKDGIPLPEEIRSAGFDWQKGWSDSWSNSREGGAYFETLHRHMVKLRPDGTFRIDGVPEGKYQLALRIYDPPPGMG
jgi:hypothetical protein